MQNHYLNIKFNMNSLISSRTFLEIINVVTFKDTACSKYFSLKNKKVKLATKRNLKEKSKIIILLLNVLRNLKFMIFIVFIHILFEFFFNKIN